MNIIVKDFNTGEAVKYTSKSFHYKLSTIVPTVHEWNIFRQMAKTNLEETIEEKLLGLYQLQKIDSSIDKIDKDIAEGKRFKLNSISASSLNRRAFSFAAFIPSAICAGFNEFFH